MIDTQWKGELKSALCLDIRVADALISVAWLGWYRPLVSKLSKLLRLNKCNYVKVVYQEHFESTKHTVH